MNALIKFSMLVMMFLLTGQVHAEKETNDSSKKIVVGAAVVTFVAMTGTYLWWSQRPRTQQSMPSSPLAEMSATKNTSPKSSWWQSVLNCLHPAPTQQHIVPKE